MPAKIRTIRGKFNNRNGLVDFNRPIGPRGGTDGLITAKQNGRVTRIKLFQDTNEDGTFNNDELIFKGKTSDATYDELTNTSRVKFTRQLHSCTWDIMKGKANCVHFRFRAYCLQINFVYTSGQDSARRLRSI